jgi:hypothetical protein
MFELIQAVFIMVNRLNIARNMGVRPDGLRTEYKQLRDQVSRYSIDMIENGEALDTKYRLSNILDSYLREAFFDAFCLADDANWAHELHEANMERIGWVECIDIDVVS